ncbi:putative LRR receptor-like serine/threonine-protein kinase [Vitis vinifera]|uniref:non-specific serine/threonine protein kinase n=1 Tax=Vitis vinifera TaxID=29760 RepID=A0A438CQ76_VITVI|nr:putative LRR receptor-like serine/threonine-protein kinase [Vitis vinifera]
MVLSFNLVDEFALIALKAHITYDSQGMLATNCSTKSSHCSWYGISCNAPQQRVSAINLSNMGLEGTIAPQIGNLSFLVSLDLSNNYFHGSLPKDIGSIPTTIFNMSSLLNISLSYNSLSGSLPMDICYANLKLKELNLSSNHLSGKVPTGLGQCIKLQGISLLCNDSREAYQVELVIGEIPQSLFNISSLRFLDLEINNLEGEISSFSHCRELRVLKLSINQFTGGIPQALGSLSNLEELYLGYNKLTGGIPREIGNLSNLNILHLASSGINGPIPAEIFNISSLHRIDFTNNSLSGSLPMDICKHLPNLQGLYLSQNHLSGQLPTTLSLCGELLLLSLSINKFTGSIPRDIGNLSKLEKIYLSTNSLIGSIPTSFGGFPSSIGTWLLDLEGLFIGGNEFNGTIPVYISNMSKLIRLHISDNYFTGNVPKDLNNLRKLEVLNLAGNQLTSEATLPNSLGNLSVALESFTASACHFRGTIPTGIVVLEIFLCYDNSLLTPNVLAFNIPTSFGALEICWFLAYLQNFLTGNLPLEVGNMKSITTLDLSKNLYFRRDNTEIPAPMIHGFLEHMKKFHSNNFFMQQTTLVFNLEFQGALRSFDSECEVMQGICHRNLIRIITCCSNLDFKALVLEYMPKGSLDKWLYSHNYFLDLFQRLTIMIDVASALEYLHHDCLSLVVHCDLKPGNVLLDNNMVAHVADFGIARLLTETESMQQTKTLGTIGYMASEDGSDGIVSTKGDVYSYGILLMEVFARKKPMDEMFTGDVTLKTWVESLSSSVIEVVDAQSIEKRG